MDLLGLWHEMKAPGDLDGNEIVIEVSEYCQRRYQNIPTRVFNGFCQLNSLCVCQELPTTSSEQVSQEFDPFWSQSQRQEKKQ